MKLEDLGDNRMKFYVDRMWIVKHCENGCQVDTYTFDEGSATCVSAGTKTGICKVCGKSVTVAAEGEPDLTAHDFSGTYEEYTGRATATYGGKKLQYTTCTREGCNRDSHQVY